MTCAISFLVFAANKYLVAGNHRFSDNLYCFKYVARVSVHLYQFLLQDKCLPLAGVWFRNRFFFQESYQKLWLNSRQLAALWRLSGIITNEHQYKKGAPVASVQLNHLAAHEKTAFPHSVISHQKPPLIVA